MSTNLQFRTLRIRIYYQLPHYKKALQSDCTNLLQYARRNKLISITVDQVKPLTDVVKGLLKGKPADELLQICHKNPAILMKEWVLEKIQEKIQEKM